MNPYQLETLLQPERYPEPTSAVRHLQTHISHLFLTDQFVYKVKKPVDFGFLDFTTLERRRHFCHEELRLNRRLSPDIYLEVVALHDDGSGGLCFGDEGQVIDYAVKMRRLPEERMLARLLDAGQVTPAEIEAIARTVAAFHAVAATDQRIASFGSLASFLLVNPPKGYVPREVLRGYYPALDAEKKKKEEVNATVSEVLRSPKFYVLWFCFFIGAGAGLMVIGSVAGMAKASMGEMAFVAVAIAAVGNAAGRIVAGVLSDRIGRRATLFIMLAFQACLMFAAIPITANPNAVMLVILATFMGFNYGSNLALFPSFAKDYWGLKNYGLNYGALFTAWGVGGFVLVQAADKIKAMPNGANNAFIAAGILLACGAAMSVFLADKKKAVAGEEVPSRWQEFWGEFSLGLKVFLGFEEPQVRAPRNWDAIEAERFKA